MAHYVTIRVLVNADTTEAAKEGLNDMMLTAQEEVDPEETEGGLSRPWIREWVIEEPKPATDELSAAIATGTFKEGSMQPAQKGWLVTTSDDGQYLYAERDGAPGVIQVKAEDEGFVVDIFSGDTMPDSVASTSATYPELEPE